LQTHPQRTQRKAPRRGRPASAAVRVRRARARCLAFPLSASRALLLPDSTLSVPGTGSLRIELAHGATAEPLPFPGWCWSGSEARLSALAFVTQRGAFERVEVENRFREPRKLRITLEAATAADGRPRLEGRRLVTAAGDLLASFDGGEPTLVRSREGSALVALELVLPPRGRRVIDIVLAPKGRTEAGSLETERGRLHAVFEELRGSLAWARLPDELFDHAFRRAWGSLVFALAPGDDRGLWVRPGAPPVSGPGTLDAVALRALDLWGAGRLVERCLENAFAWQGRTAPPGEAFRRAEGYLSAPLDGPVRERWVSDCGALLWAASARGEVGAGVAWLRSARPHIEAACSWILGELGPEGLLPEGLSPRFARGFPGAWTDGWSWKGLDAAARALDRLGATSAGRLRSATEAYRRSIARSWAENPAARVCLETLGCLPRGTPRRAPLATPAALAAELASCGLDPLEELRVSAAFLTALGRMLLREEAGTLHIFPDVPRHWLAPGRSLDLERLRSSSGPVSAHVLATSDGSRLLAELALPRGAGRATLHLPAPGPLGRVRVNGARVRAREGFVELPARGGEFLIEAGL